MPRIHGVSLPERFGVNLRRARQAAHLSQEELGGLCGLHRTEISLLERGEREPRMETLTKLAGGLGVATDVFHDGIVWPPAGESVQVTPAPLPPPRVKRPPEPHPSR